MLVVHVHVPHSTFVNKLFVVVVVVYLVHKHPWWMPCPYCSHPSDLKEKYVEKPVDKDKKKCHLKFLIFECRELINEGN